MSIKPMLRSNICINAHPQGCKKAVEDQIEYIKKQAASYPAGSKKPKNVLVLGCSGGYGLASRITAAFGYGAATIGISFEKAGSERKWGTPGWYNNRAFDTAAQAAGLTAVTIDGDAFADSIKQTVIAEAEKHGITFDLVIYSLASSVRTDPETGEMYRSVLKPLGKAFTGKTIDPFTGALSGITAEPATDEEAAATVKVMGGEDWQRWIDQLAAAGVLAEGCITLAYSYIGPEATQDLYRKGTIGKAKEHLEKTAHTINASLAALHGKAFVSVNKGMVTRASAVIPVIPLYLVCLFKVMKEKGTHEGCIEQMNRLFSSRLYTQDGSIPVDSENRIRLDDWELADDVQAAVLKLMDTVTGENSSEYTDLAEYRHSFLAINGFDIDGIDYDAEILRFDTL
ncbi:MAG: trans-2-enoyl-CoA reductase family protein [Treponema sp.]